MNNLSLTFLLAIFLFSGLVIWLAGTVLTKTTDCLDKRFKIGDALGGFILLGIAGSLPEIAVVHSAARHGHIPVITGNLLGGIAIQTLILVIFDLASKGKKPLSYLAGTKILFFETILAITITVLAIIGTRINPTFNFFSINPLSIAILITWIIGVILIDILRTKHPRYNFANTDLGSSPRDYNAAKFNHPFYGKKSTTYVLGLFSSASVIILICGLLLEQTGSLIASNLGISSGLFAATAMALVTSLPEISTGLESIFIGDNQLAISDIIGGNAFMLVLFVFADITAQKPILSYAEKTDLMLGCLGLIMMIIYAITFIRKIKKRYFRLGIDSIFEIIIYFFGIFVLSKWF